MDKTEILERKKKEKKNEASCDFIKNIYALFTVYWINNKN